MTTANRQMVLLLGTALMAVGGCGRSGMSMRDAGSDAGLTAGAGGGSSATANSSSGGTTSSSHQGGASWSAGNSGQAGALSSGGIVATGGSSGGQATLTSKAREPKLHRPQALSCVGVFAPGEPVNTSLNGCKKHADCTQGTNGRCITPDVGMGRNSYFYCTYDQCATDANCDRGKVCYCSPSNSPRCFLKGNCQIDSDCLGGALGYCSPAYGFDCGGYRTYGAYYCHTPADTCLDDSDCLGNDYCDYEVIKGRWECKSPDMSCIIG